MANEALVLSSANLQTIEENLDYFATNLKSVTLNMTNIHDKVDVVTANVLTLEEEIRKMMLEIKGTTILSSAKQSIVINQNEWQKNFSQHEVLRRNILGILQATDIGLVRKNSIENLQNEVLFNTPNYWLAPAIVAISAWLSDQKEIAEKSLNEALKRDKLKTSLLLTLVYLRVNRTETATKWLKYYLNELDSSDLDNLIIVILNSLNDQCFTPAQQKMVINFFEEKITELNNLSTYKKENIERWKNLFRTKEGKISDTDFFAIKEYTNEGYFFKNQLNKIITKQNILDYFSEFVNQPDSQTYNKNESLDKLTNLVVNEYSGEELKLKKEIYKNTLIVEEEGDTEKALEKMKSSELLLNEKNNLYNHLYNCVVEQSFINPSNNSRKMALSFQKDNVLEAYNEYINEDNYDNNYVINYTIGDYKGTIKDGYSEKTEKENIRKLLLQKDSDERKKVPIFNIKMIIAILAMIVSVYLLKGNTVFIIIIIGVIIAFLIYEGYTNYKKIKSIESKNLRKMREYFLVLEDIISEVVYLKEIISEDNTDEEISTLLNNLNHNNYLVNNEERMIMVGDNYE